MIPSIEQKPVWLGTSWTSFIAQGFLDTVNYVTLSILEHAGP